MTYILNDDFSGGTWVDPNGVTHNMSSGINGTLPSTSIWNIAVGSGTFNGSTQLVWYPGTTTYLHQDGASNLVFTVGPQGTGGAPANMWPSAYVDASATGEQSAGTPKFAMQLNQSCEFRVSVNAVVGLWTVCWFLGSNSNTNADYAEIDLMEAGDAGQANPQPTVSQSSFYGGPGSNPTPFGNSKNSTVGDGFHVYRVDYTENSITTWRDGVLDTATPITPASGSPASEWNFTAANGILYPILQVHIAKAVSSTPAASALPVDSMKVDYVRIWAPAGPDPNTSGANITATMSAALGPLATQVTAASAAAGAVITSMNAALGPLAMNAVVNGGTGGGGAGSTASFTDAFGVDDSAANWQNSSGTTEIANGWYRVQCDNAYSSGAQTTSTYNLTGSSAFAQFAPFQTVNSETGFQLYTDSNNTMTFDYAGGQLSVILKQAGVTVTSPSATYDPVLHAWWRIREQTGTLLFDTSADGQNWSSFYSTPYTMAVTALFMNVYAGNFTANATGNSYFSNFNVNPAAAATLVDGFDSNDLATVWAWTFGTVAVSGGECSIQCDTSFSSELISSVTYNLTGGAVAGQFLPRIAASAQTALQVFSGDGTGSGSTYEAEIGYSGGLMYATLFQNGVTTNSPTVTYSAVNHSWWRIRESSGTLFFETSANSITWAQLWSSPYAFSASGVTVAVFAGDNGTDATGTSFVTNINVGAITGVMNTALAPLAVSATAASTTGSPTTSTSSMALGPLATAITCANTPPLSFAGTPTLVRSTSGSVTASYGTGQSDTAGDLLIAVATAAAGTSATAVLCSTTGWAQIVQEGNSATAHARVSFWYKVAAGSDTAPTFTSTLTGTGAMTATLYEVVSYDTTGTTGWLDCIGVYASGSTPG